MPIVLARVDDRLIHGQVVTGWVRALGVNSIVIVNDKVAVDKTQQMILAMFAPPGIKVTGVKIDDAVKAYSAGDYEKPNVMMLFTNPSDVVRLIEGGVALTHLNVGGMQFKQGKKQISRTVSVDAQDSEAFTKLLSRGVQVEIRMFMSDTKQDVGSLLPK